MLLCQQWKELHSDKQDEGLKRPLKMNWSLEITEKFSYLAINWIKKPQAFKKSETAYFLRNVTMCISWKFLFHHLEAPQKSNIDPEDRLGS